MGHPVIHPAAQEPRGIWPGDPSPVTAIGQVWPRLAYRLVIERCAELVYRAPWEVTYGRAHGARRGADADVEGHPPSATWRMKAPSAPPMARRDDVCGTAYCRVHARETAPVCW